MRKFLCPMAKDCPYRNTPLTCVHMKPHVKSDSCNHDKSQPIECPWCREIGARGKGEGNG